MDDPAFMPDPSAVDAAAERRGQPRTPCFLEGALSGDGNAPPFRRVTLLNLSAGGVLLLLQDPHWTGDALRLTFETVTGQLFRIRADVVHVEFRHGSWLAGCRFVRPLTDDELVALL
jgi:PilZ domain-containing protein